MRRKLFLLFTVILFVCAESPKAYSFHGNPVATFNALSVEADPQTGSAGFGIPITIPAGRGGIQPSLQLQYNSNLPNVSTNTIQSRGWRDKSKIPYKKPGKRLLFIKSEINKWLEGS